MILLLAIITGLFAGSVRAWRGGRRLSSPNLQFAWLVPVAFLPQLLAFYLPATRKFISDDLASAALVGSQLSLLTFAWFNRTQPGVWALALGLACNLLVITINGGLMPISPETLAQLDANASRSWQVDHRLGTGKDVVLAVDATRLGWLSDRFLLPTWFPYRVAFSPGDVLIAAGAFWLLWALGGPSHMRTAENDLRYAHD